MSYLLLHISISKILRGPYLIYDVSFSCLHNMISLDKPNYGYFHYQRIYLYPFTSAHQT